MSAVGRCDRADCTRQHKFDRAWFDKRLGFHMFLVDFSNLFRFFGGDPHYQRIWPERLYDAMNPIHLPFGSLMNIDLHANQLTSRTFDLLKTHWIWPNLYSLQPNNPRFLSSLLRLVDLGSFIDNKALVNHLHRTRLVQQDRPSFLMRRERDGYVVLALLAFLRADEYDSIHAGAAFIQKIPVDVTVLCRFLELVIGSFVIASTFKRAGSLHGVTLPRSWILENVRKLHKVQRNGAHPNSAWAMAQLFQDLLENIYTGNDVDHLLYQNKSLNLASVRVRNFILARFTLVGFNLRNTPLRDLIWESITSLRRKDPNRMFSSLINQYVYAQDWSRIAFAVTSSIPETQLDEMITLVDERMNAPRAAFPASMLNPTASSFVPTSQPRAQANDAQPPVEAPTEQADEADDLIQEDPEEEDTESPPEVVDVAAMIGSIGTNVTKISEEDLTKQQHAAKTLESYYCLLQARRAKQIANPGLGLSKTRKDRFEAFAQAANSIEWPERSLYRPIFLGALPHLLVCLDYTWTIVMDEKAKVKRASRKHQEIEDLLKRQTTLRWVYDGVRIYQVPFS
ncbi:hypothetical protein EDB86DRAFT_2875623 [Lactarius hatsudake]|nr:hypothetical protein EDB86DRAFT_2875623 [Lactarius hatsudake]